MKIKNVLLTGGSRGIGAAIKDLLEENGYNVISPSRKELDLSNLESVKNYCGKIHELDISFLINNAGVNYIVEIGDMQLDLITETINVNLISPILLSQAVWENFSKKNFGRIINISSIWSEKTKAGRSIYSTTKSGLNGLTRTLAVEGANKNILVNSICPGYIDTELTRKNNNVSQLNEIRKKIPMNKLGNPNDIAEVVLFLISTRNKYITGQMIIVDGGFSII